MLMPAAASVGAALGLLGITKLLPQISSAPVQLAVDLVVYLALYATIWIGVPGGRQHVSRLIELAREAIAAGPRVLTAGESFRRESN
jgi:hypothetical protein